MRKKVLIMIVCLLSSLAVAYIYLINDNHSLSASTSQYNAGGNVTGRINIAPNNLNVNNLEFQKGDRILLGTMNPELNEPIALQLVEKSTYAEYNCSVKPDYLNPSTCTPLDNPSETITAWLSFTTKALGHPTTGITMDDFISAEKLSYSYAPYTSSNFYAEIDSLNNAIHEQDRKILTYPNTGSITYYIAHNAARSANIAASYNIIGTNYNRRGFYLQGGHFYNLRNKKDLVFNEDMWSGTFYTENRKNFINAYIKADGTLPRYVDQVASGVNTGLNDTGLQYALRPCTDVDVRNVVFSISQGSDDSIGKVSIPMLPTDYSALYLDAVGNPMKLRVKNEALTASTKLNQIENKNNVSIRNVIADRTVYLNAFAESGNDSANGNGDSVGVYTVSALIFSEDGDFLYYKPLGTAKGNAKYALNLTGIPAGNYKIGIVNEAYNENSSAPADSSAITDVLPLEIEENLTITAVAKNGLEYSKNANHNDIVATYITNDPEATTTLISDTSVGGHENDYLLFSLSNGNVVVNDSNGLNAGDYYFKIHAVDAYGKPDGGIDSATVHVSVARTDATVVFDNANTTKISIADAATTWNEFATANPSLGTKIRYEVSGGDAFLIDLDHDTGAITYKGNGAYGKVKIRATVDDDSSSGFDNYESAFTEKEIIIYKKVDGNVEPHENSSDSSTPTFTATDPNVKINGIIGTIKGTTGTPDVIDGSSSKITYQYGLETGSDSGLFKVDPNTGVITTTSNLATKAYNITVTVSDKWDTKEIPVTINVGVAAAENLQFYETSSALNMITQKSVKITDTNVKVFATVKGSTNNNQVSYKIKDGSTNVVTVNASSGAITINGVGTIIIVAEKQGNVGQADAYAELTFTVTAGAQNFIYTDSAGNELPKNGNAYSAYVEQYAKRKTFQLYTSGNPTGSTVTYQLKAGSPTDVISVNSNGEVSVLNASISPSQIGRVIIEATSHDPTGNYSDKTIELPINITKAKQTISFKETTYVSNGKGSVAPIINEQDISSNEGGVSVPDTSYYISVDTSITNNIAYTNDGITIHYDYTGEDGIDIPLHVVKAGNRNYEKAEADGTLHIMSPDENILATTNMGKIVYGDHFEIRSLQDDSSSTNVQYQFEVDNTTYISNPTVYGNKAEFDALKVSGKTNITIKVKRTANGETALSKTITVQVLPKEIEIVIDNKEKYKGEQNPTLTYQDFRSQLVSWNGVQDSIQENDIKLSTTAKTDSPAGSYQIKGDSNTLNKTYPNYSFTFKEGTLKIKEDVVEDDWYHLEVDDGNNTPYTGNWINQNVNIISDHPEYNNLSLDQSTWNPTKVTVSKEGETNQSFWMKKDSGAITKEKKETIKIDKTAPKVKGIKAKDTNNKLQDIINKLSGGIFFKPGTAFEITTDDSKDDLKVSGTKEIAYKVYKIEQQARSTDELIKDGTLTVTNEKANITISETTGKYKVCVTPTDKAGNTNAESCHEVTLKKINVDVDNDGKLDFNDPDGDGCPDLNIVLGKDEDGFYIKLNIDNNNDGIPELNIDTDGDGKPDINVDLDDDGKPDLNIATKIKWNPTYCVLGQAEEYCTDQSIIPDLNIDLDGDGRPDINIDLDEDGIPDIDIDTNGDGKPDINIDTNKDGKADENLKEITEWNPNESFTVDGKKYNTMTNLAPDKDEQPEQPNDPNKQGNNTDVKGAYYPGDNTGGAQSIGGASTGDDTNMTFHLSVLILVGGVISYLLNEYKKDTFQ